MPSPYEHYQQAEEADRQAEKSFIRGENGVNVQFHQLQALFHAVLATYQGYVSPIPPVDIPEAP